MAALISFPSSDTAHLSLTLSSAFLFSAATAFVFVMSKVQPSHLAEERRPTLQEHPLHSQPTNALLSAQSSLDSLRTSWLKCWPSTKHTPSPCSPRHARNVPLRGQACSVVAQERHYS
ncbi:hypothetical protein AMTR_s00044p00129040 [Amborella trichopoda]|uniref:Uncharacterized protein n=1 Tax=Amborella trichopoda TaxID=13333 RepID=U5CV06_AMBTC|nr:hypothetical protein AMTR_s00044p00129040 [Amborella trichopoda]